MKSEPAHAENRWMQIKYIIEGIILMCVVVKYEDGVTFTSVVSSYVYSDRFADVAHRHFGQSIRQWGADGVELPSWDYLHEERLNIAWTHVGAQIYAYDELSN